MKQDLSWIGPLRHDNRAALADEKRRVRPAKSETTADGDQEASGHALESRLAERLGHGEAGMESEEGTALSTFLGASRVVNGLCRPDDRSADGSLLPVTRE